MWSYESRLVQAMTIYQKYLEAELFFLSIASRNETIGGSLWWFLYHEV